MSNVTADVRKFIDNWLRQDHDETGGIRHGIKTLIAELEAELATTKAELQEFLDATDEGFGRSSLFQEMQAELAVLRDFCEGVPVLIKALEDVRDGVHLHHNCMECDCATEIATVALAQFAHDEDGK